MANFQDVFVPFKTPDTIDTFDTLSYPTLLKRLTPLKHPTILTHMTFLIHTKLPIVISKLTSKVSSIGWDHNKSEEPPHSSNHSSRDRSAFKKNIKLKRNGILIFLLEIIHSIFLLRCCMERLNDIICQKLLKVRNNFPILRCNIWTLLH